MKSLIIIVTVGSLVLSCDSSDSQTSPALTQPIPFHDTLAYLDSATNSLILLKPRDNHVGLKRLAVPKGAAVVRNAKRPDDDLAQLVVLSPSEQKLALIRDTGGFTDVLPLGISTSTLDIADNGRYAAIYPSEFETLSHGIFSVAGRLIIADLSVAHPQTHLLSLGSQTKNLQKVIFSEVLEHQTESGQRLQNSVAFAFVDGGIRPIDLQVPMVLPFIVVSEDSTQQVQPQKVLFTNNRGDSYRGVVDGIEHAFVLTTNGELFVLAITVSENFTAQVTLENIITPNVPLFDVTLHFDTNGNELLLASAGNALFLVDGYSGVARRFEQSVYTQHLLPFTDPNSGRPKTIAWAPNQQHILMVDVLDLQDRLATGVVTKPLADTLTNVVMPSNNSVALLHYGLQRFGLWDLGADGLITDLQIAYPTTALYIEQTRGRVWLAGLSTYDKKPHLGFFDLANPNQTVDIRLSDSAEKLGQLGSYLWISHFDATSVTFVPLDNPTQNATIRVDDLHLVHILNSQPPDNSSSDGDVQ